MAEFFFHALLECLGVALQLAKQIGHFAALHHLAKLRKIHVAETAFAHSSIGTQITSAHAADASQSERTHRVQRRTQANALARSRCAGPRSIRSGEIELVQFLKQNLETDRHVASAFRGNREHILFKNGR